MGRRWPNPDDPTEPYFLEEDTDAVLEWQREQNLKCSGCGLPRDETMAKESQDRYKGGVIRCHACKARYDHEKDFMKAPHVDGGLYFTVKEKDAG